MALSIYQDPQGVDWPLGFVAVANNGTPVNIMVNVDANNSNAPGTFAAQPGSPATTSEYTPRCHKVTFVGIKPGNNNNGMINNTGNVYVMRTLGPGNQNMGGPGNRSDSGAMVYVVFPGSSTTIPSDEMDMGTISPYRYSLDADVNGEGALVTLLGCVR